MHVLVEKSISYNESTLEYYQYGDNPKLLIHSGLHGDEYSIIPIVEEMVKKYLYELPSFVFIPQVSPSAVSLQTRLNANNQDLNRSFIENPTESEALANIELVKPFHFNLLVSFHEDTEFEGFYIYDSLYPTYRNDINSFCTYLLSQNILLFTGVDDPSDPVHGYTVVNGHVLWGIEYNKPLNGTFDDWAIKGGIVDRLLMPETPTSISLDKKIIIIEGIFTKLIIPFFRNSDLESPSSQTPT